VLYLVQHPLQWPWSLRRAKVPWWYCFDLVGWWWPQIEGRIEWACEAFKGRGD
jgi:hypothetical protein